jgi:hypothetical protein
MISVERERQREREKDLERERGGDIIKRLKIYFERNAKLQVI